VAVQQELSVLAGDAATLAVAEELGLATLARTPLAMGLLTGKYALDRRPPAGDVRRDTPHWTWFDDEAMPGWLDRLARVRGHLTADGRTLAQGALAWVWARSPGAIPIPGFRTAEQVEANVAAAALGPLPETAMAAIEAELRPGGGSGA
jgi:aryl-alcohol dehydrogenase-like predicted oxidoreductase